MDGGAAKCAKSLLAEETGQDCGTRVISRSLKNEKKLFGGGLHYLDDESGNGFKI